MPFPKRPRLLIVSGVLPFRPRSGQEQRVAYTLREFRKAFEVTLLTRDHDAGLARMSPIADEIITWAGPYSCSFLHRAFRRALGLAYSAVTGLKRSNYELGKVQFSLARIEALLGGRTFDCALFEYWHAVEATAAFKAHDIPCVLDMHDILWKSYEVQLARKSLPRWYRDFRVRQYRGREERAWRQFDGVIAINHDEFEYVRHHVANVTLFHTPMGIDMGRWPYCWNPVEHPRRVAYYGSLSGAHHYEPIMRCYQNVMPEIWKRQPATELWLVGDNPPETIRALASDPRVKVTGFVENICDILASMTAVLCPWRGAYGFRSRLIETMAVGTPAIATPDAVHGMDLEDGAGVLIGLNDLQVAAHALRLIERPDEAARQSSLARQQVESRFSSETTYGRLASDLRHWLETRRLVA